MDGYIESHYDVEKIEDVCELGRLVMDKIRSKSTHGVGHVIDGYNLGKSPGTPLNHVLDSADEVWDDLRSMTGSGTRYGFSEVAGMDMFNICFCASRVITLSLCCSET